MDGVIGAIAWCRQSLQWYCTVLCVHVVLSPHATDFSCAVPADEAQNLIGRDHIPELANIADIADVTGSSDITMF